MNSKYFGIILVTFVSLTLPLFVHSEGVTLSVTICDSSGDCGSTSGGGGSSSGGGGGGGGGTSSSGSGVIIEGIAYPNRRVVLLQNGQVAAESPAGANARFRFEVANVSSGVHTFGVYADDTKGNKSITYTFTVKITSSVTTNISGIILPPTISIDKSEVKHGDPINVVGYSYPGSNVSVVINSENEIIKNLKPDSSGFWALSFNTYEVEKGDHSTSAISSSNDGVSTASNKLFFKVGDKNVLINNIKKTAKGDQNADGKINIVDFSVMAYWYKRTLNSQVEKIVDLNGDKKVNLVDFSILAYNWTG